MRILLPTVWTYGNITLAAQSNRETETLDYCRKGIQLQLAKEEYGAPSVYRGDRAFKRKINRVLSEGNFPLLIGAPATIREFLGPVYLQQQLQLLAPVYGSDGRLQIPDGIVYTSSRLFFIDDAGLYNPFHMERFVMLAKRFSHRVVMSVAEIDDITYELQELVVGLRPPLLSGPVRKG